VGQPIGTNLGGSLHRARQFTAPNAQAHYEKLGDMLMTTQINPFVYLRDVIDRVSIHPARLVLELTPRQ
jgi:hypothetical protein